MTKFVVKLKKKCRLRKCGWFLEMHQIDRVLHFFLILNGQNKLTGVTFI